MKSTLLFLLFLWVSIFVPPIYGEKSSSNLSDKYEWALEDKFDISKTERGIWAPNFIKEKIKKNTYTISAYTQKTENLEAKELYSYRFNFDGKKYEDKNTTSSQGGLKIVHKYESRYNSKTKKAWVKQSYKAIGGDWSIRNLKEGQTLSEEIQFDLSDRDKVSYRHKYKFSGSSKKELNLQYVRR